jgi:hypothetical protein
MLVIVILSSALQETHRQVDELLASRLMAKTRHSWQRAQGAVGWVESGSGGVSKGASHSPTRSVPSSNVV